MKISLNWLKDFIAFQASETPESIAWKLTEASATIERVENLGKGLDRVVVGELLEFTKHPDADQLYVGKVKISPKQTIQVIFGQKAVVSPGDKLATAIAPAELHGGKVEARKVRGVLSEGMLCLDSELIPGASEVATKFEKNVKIGTSVRELMMLGDQVLEIDNHSLTHRSDLFSHTGFALECVALGLAKWKKRTAKPVKFGKRPLPVKPMFPEKNLTKSYHSTIISNLSTKPSPLWMKRRLEAVGVRPINAIVDVTNYLMMEMGQPCHAFDLRLLEGKEFKMRSSKKGEEVTTLDGMKRQLPEGVIIVESGGKIIDLAGIMGGLNSEIKDDTTSIYFHSSHFNNVLIRRAMIALGHRTEGGTMHEKNIEPERARAGFFRGLELFKEIFPEARFDVVPFHHQPETSPKKEILLTEEKLKKHSGLEISGKEMKKILSDLMFTVKPTKGGFKVSPPPWRNLTTNIPEDVIEEVVRIHGYSKVPALSPPVTLKTPAKNHKRQVKRTLQHFLTGHGFQEELNFSFLSEVLLTKSNISKRNELIEIKNPVSDDFRYMRPSLMPYLMQNMARHQLLAEKSWRTFEIGKTFKKMDETVLEETAFAALLSRPTSDQVFYEAKGFAMELFRELGVNADLREVNHHHFAYPKRELTLWKDDELIGFIYELHPALRDQFKIKDPTAVIELHLDRLYQIPAAEVTFRQINRNPAALLDLSVLVEKTMKMKDVEKMIRSVEPQFLQELVCKEVYQGQGIDPNKKSFTFSLKYQHPDRTIDDQEIQKILQTLISKIESSGATVRR